MSILQYIQETFANLSDGFFGLRLGSTRVIHTNGKIYNGYVYDIHDNKYPIVVRYSVDTATAPLTNSISGYVLGIGIRIAKDSIVMEESMKKNSEGVSMSRSLIDKGCIADCLFVHITRNKPIEDINNVSEFHDFFNHSYIRPQSVTQALSLSKAVSLLRLTGIFSCVVKIEKVLKILGYPKLSDQISERSIAKLNIFTENPLYNKIVISTSNDNKIAFYVDKVAKNPDPTSLTSDSDNIKFVHDGQTFPIDPKYKTGIWRLYYITGQFILYTWKYFTNSFSKDIYEEIPYQYKKNREISIL